MEWIMRAREYTIAVVHDKEDFYGMKKPPKHTILVKINPCKMIRKIANSTKHYF